MSSACQPCFIVIIGLLDSSQPGDCAERVTGMLNLARVQSGALWTLTGASPLAQSKDPRHCPGSTRSCSVGVDAGMHAQAAAHCVADHALVARLECVRAHLPHSASGAQTRSEISATSRVRLNMLQEAAAYSAASQLCTVAAAGSKWTSYQALGRHAGVRVCAILDVSVSEQIT